MVASFVYSTRFLLLLFVLASYVVSAAAFDSSSCDATIPNGSSGFSSSTSSSLRNAALVFLKPHANTPAAQKLVRQTLGQNGISIISETSIDAETIEREKLIDQHYYAIGMCTVWRLVTLGCDAKILDTLQPYSFYACLLSIYSCCKHCAILDMMLMCE